MNLAEIILIAISLAMDAFAVSVCKGLVMQEKSLKKTLIVAAYFAGFQMLMPLIGYMIGRGFADMADAVDHWIAFVLLSIIGGKMIWEACNGKDKRETDDVSFKNMIFPAVATSIDALVVGMTFAFLKVNLKLCLIVIGLITFILSCVGVKLGKIIGEKFRKNAEIIGGIILICLGIKILLEGVGII